MRASSHGRTYARAVRRARARGCRPSLERRRPEACGDSVQRGRRYNRVLGKFVHSIQVLALSWGAPGILVVAFLDSSILSLPEIADLLVIWMVTTHPARFALYVTSATIGSLLGCLTLYYLGK